MLKICCVAIAMVLCLCLEPQQVSGQIVTTEMNQYNTDSPGCSEKENPTVSANNGEPGGDSGPISPGDDIVSPPADNGDTAEPDDEGGIAEPDNEGGIGEPDNEGGTAEPGDVAAGDGTTNQQVIANQRNFNSDDSIEATNVRQTTSGGDGDQNQIVETKQDNYNSPGSAELTDVEQNSQ